MQWRIYKPRGAPISATNVGTWVYDELRQLSVYLQALPLACNTTTAELVDAESPINRLGKYAGRQAYNETTGLPLWAAGPAPTATWNNASGVPQHTPV